MKKLLVLCLMIIAIPAFGAPPTRVYTYSAGGIIQPNEVTANEDAIFRYLTAGVDTLTANSVNTLQLYADSVTTSKILDGTIVNADISATAGIAYSKLNLVGLLTGADLAANIDISTTGTIATTAALSTTATATVSGLSVTGMIKDKDGDWPTSNQILVGGNVGVNWEDKPKLGAWDAKAQGTVYQAATDGFAVTYTLGAQVLGYTDSANPPTTVRCGAGSDTTSGGFSMPVKKGDYWKTVGGSVFWLPLGN